MSSSSGIRRLLGIYYLKHTFRYRCIILKPTYSNCMFSSNKEKTESKKESRVTIYINYINEGVKDIAVSTIDMVKNPSKTWHQIKDICHHYWVGTKLLVAEIKLASQILGRVFRGSSMTRRERMQLIRTSTDIFRLVPFSIFVIVPFMEFLLPFALRIFPNMLPSTFQDELKKEENMKKELQMRLAIASFLQETLQEMTLKRAKTSEAKEVIQFIEKARNGEPLPNESVMRIASLFKDEFTLQNIQRPQLVSMCQFMSLPPWGSDSFLRFQLRNKFRIIKDDDKRILWEGIESLTTSELRDACQVRGMRAHGLPSTVYSKQLQEWLDLSRSVPISLLIMSRAFTITSSSQSHSDDVKSSLQSSISSFSEETINEVVLSAASEKEEKTIELQKRKLESLQFQKEMIDDELEMSTKTVNGINATVENSKILLSDGTKSAPEFTADEIESLGDLARASSVQREKAKLSILESAIAIDTVEPKQVIAAKENVVELRELESFPKSDNAADAMRNVLNKMVGKLKNQLDKTEKALGDRLRLLDLDNDGSISAEELKTTIFKILKRSNSTTNEEIEEFITALDHDNDGKVKVIELLRFAEERRRNEEVEQLEPHKATIIKDSK